MDITLEKIEKDYSSTETTGGIKIVPGHIYYKINKVGNNPCTLVVSFH